MRIGSAESSGKQTSPKKSVSLKWFLVLVGLVALVAYSGTLIAIGMALFREIQPRGSEMAARAAVREIPGKVVETIENHIEAARQSEPFERIHLDIAFKGLEKLRAKRAEALRLGNLIASDDDFVKATIRHRGESVRTTIRLKGDLLDHLEGDKWSFRVHTRKSEQLFGMRRFSLQSPAARDHQGEPIFLEHLKKEGVLSPRYFFVDVSVNGKDIGVMAIEEHFSKELLESQQRKEGVILRFDESPFWMNRNLNGTFGPYSNPYVAMIKPFRSSKIAKSELLSGDLDAAIGLLRGFMDGDLAPHDVFDVVRMARFMAVVEVWNAHHALGWHNLRFYYNPLIARLEPVGFDGHLKARPIGPGLAVHSGYFMPLLLEDPRFRAVFVRELSRIASELADGGLADWARERERDLLPRLQEGIEYVDLLPIDRAVARARRLALIDEDNFDHFMPPLGDPNMTYPSAIRFYVCNGCSPARLEFVNALPIPVTIRSITIREKSKKAVSELEGVTTPIELQATEPQKRPRPTHVRLAGPIDLGGLVVEAMIQVDGQEKRHAIRAEPYVESWKNAAIPSVTLAQALARHDFLRWDAEAETVRVKKGRHVVEGSVVIPEDLPLSIGPGTELRFGEGKFLLASGPLSFEGTAQKPILFGPRPGSTTWGGIAGIRSNAPHVWKNVVVESTTGIERPGWRLTGGVTLRATHVVMADSVFRGHKGEDALNLIRTTFEMDNVEFDDAHSDALDADYSNGKIRGGRWTRVGGDGIDVSGANIEVVGVYLADIVDKAISVGEASKVTVNNIHAERVGTGAASKDRSELLIEDSVIDGASTAGVSVYMKKPEYGPATATVNRVEMNDVATPVLVQIGSRATLDGESVEEVPLVTETLY